MEIYAIEDQQDIPIAVKRNKGYISQVKSRKHIPDDFIELLKLKYPKAFLGYEIKNNTDLEKELLKKRVEDLEKIIMLLEKDKEKNVSTPSEPIKRVKEK